MTPEQLHILQHSLGLDQYGQGSMYRNRFVTGPGSTDFPKCKLLCETGLMKDWGPVPVYGGDHIFTVTKSGMETVKKESPPPPKLTRSQQRYRQWLKADLGIPFGEYLKLKRLHHNVV